jgi:hypothetical protein
MGFYEESKYDCISIEEAIALGTAQEHNTYTEEKYYIEGTVTGLYNTTYGNMYITDGTNQICVYGLYSEDGTVRYDKMEVKPVDGTKVVIYGVIGQYNGAPQFKNAWLMEIVGGETPAPHEHNFVNGKCECGEKDPNYVEPPVSGNEIVFDFTAGGTTMESAYNAAEAEMTVNGYVFGYLQMKASGYSGSNFLMFCKSTEAHLYNKTAFASPIVKVEVSIPSGASATAGYFLSLHKEAAAGNIVSTTKFVGNNASFSIEATEADGFTFFNLSSDASTGKNGQLGKIVVTLANGSVVVPPVHEHKFVDGVCECGEKDPNYVAPEAPAFGVVTEFKEDVAYKFGLVQGNTNKTLFVTGNYKNTYYGESTEDLAAAADVYVVAVSGGYNLKLVKVDGTVLYINVVASGTHKNIKFEAAASSVWTYNAELNTFTTTVADAEVYIGTYGTYDTISPSTIDKAATSFVGHLYGGVQAEEPEHEHKFVEGVCECGEKDPNYVAPEAPVAANKADLDTLNGGKHSSSYLDYTSTNGWTVTGCAINSGSADSSSTANPSFGCLGGAEVRAVTLNGGTDKTLGTVKSGVLSGGLSKLSFNYTNLFSDTKFSVTVYIKDAQGNVLKEEVVSYDNPNKVKYEVRTFELEFAVEGDFIIEIVNNRPNNLSGNKDRATIWNIEWVSAK